MPGDALGGLIDGGLSLTKIDKEPPIYEFSFKGYKKVVRIPLSTLRSKTNVDWAMFGAWDFHPLDVIGVKEWRSVTDEWVKSKDMKVIEADEIGLSHRIIMSTKRFFDHFSEGKSWEDLNSGMHIVKTHKEKDYYCFKDDPLYKWVRRDLGFPVKTDSVEAALRQVGLLRGRSSFFIYLGSPGKSGRAWEIPCDIIDAFPQAEAREEEATKEEAPSEVEGEEELPFL